MKNSQLVEILKSLDKTEFREFGKFVRSPYFNNRSEVTRFFESLKSFYPSFKSNNFSGEIIFRQVYPGKKYSGVLMRKLVSLLISLAMDFIAISSYQENKLDYNVKLLNALYEKKLPSVFEKKAKSTEALLQKSKHTFEYYESNFNFTSKLNGYLSGKKESATVLKYQKELDDFIEYFLSVVLLIYHRLDTFSNVYNVKYDLKLYDEVIAFLNRRDYSSVTLVSMYYNMAMLAKTQEEKYFEALAVFTDKFEDKLTDLFQYNIYVTMYDYCLNRINKGEITYKERLFGLTKKYFDKRKFPKECVYISLLFPGVVRIAAQLKKFNWAEKFIGNYRRLLEPETAAEIINYSLAILEFEKGDFLKSLSYLSTINPERLSMKLNSKNLLIMVYYELNYTEELISLIDAYRHFQRRDKKAVERLKQRDANFIRFVSALVRVKLKKRGESALSVKKEIEAAPYFTLKDWLLKKTDELGK